MQKTLITVTILFISTFSFGQKVVRDSVMTIPLFFGTYGGNIPGGDYAKRFSANSEIGGGFILKTKNNWLFTFESSYIFGKIVKDTNVFGNILASNNKIIGQDGLDADVRVFQRGSKLPVLKIGRLFPFKIWNASKNSGFFVNVGWGILHHRIKIEDVTNTAPQVTGDYVKGYDKLTNGGMVVENLGYIYFDRKRYVNFFTMFEFTQGFTKSRRSFNFGTATVDTQKRLDLLWGFKLGVIFPIYKKLPDEYYVY